MKEIKDIIVTKAKVHNLKSIDVKIPKNTLSVITGPSGSGKSSLAFDTIYVEGQRRYIESLSSYARQFLGQYDPPDVESIEGLSPSIAIDQKTSSRNPRSTVGTITEIYDYFRILFARVGTLYCPDSGEEIEKWSSKKISTFIQKKKEGSKIQILSPQQSISKYFSVTEINKFIGLGFSKFTLAGKVHYLDDESIKILKSESHFDLVVDRIVLKKGIQKRLIESVELGLKLGSGNVTILINDKAFQFSEKNKSQATGEIFPNLEPNLFSFNSPVGACAECNGLGILKTFDENIMIEDSTLSIEGGAIPLLIKGNNFLYSMIKSIAKIEKAPLDKPLSKLPKRFTEVLFNGSEKVYQYDFSSDNSEFHFKKAFPGLTTWLDKKYRETNSERVRKRLEQYMDIKKCPYCKGSRLNRIALSTTINKKNIMDFCQLPVDECLFQVKKIKFTGNQKIIAEKILKEILSRLNFLRDVGLNYLSLNRAANTLSGGESQRIRLATQIGSALSGVLYVLDEPSIGLHQKDNLKLIKTLKNLRDLGNTVLVVEHDEETIINCDYIIDIGPGAGIHGGEIVFSGKPEAIKKSKKSPTAKYLKDRSLLSSFYIGRTSEDYLELRGAKEHNLKNIDIQIPLNCFTCITGVSGSGKSTLIHKVTVPALRNALTKKELYQKNFKEIKGYEKIRSVIELDQSPIGRTPHSNPATYTGLFDGIRTIFSQTTESQIRGYRPGRFSFNVKGGRCETCEGNGVKKIEMHFLPDVYVTCEDCNGSRYNEETLSVFYKGKSISDVLKMSIEDALEFFKNHKKLNKILSTLNSVGLGYMKLGQPATTLSGGEAQRLKLCKELSKSTRGHTLYILDEPTTGLHFQDIVLLLKAIQSLVDNNNSVIVIEHNLDVVRNADHIIDLGPEGGEKGGEVVAIGNPIEIAKNKKSQTGKYL